MHGDALPLQPGVPSRIVRLLKRLGVNFTIHFDRQAGARAEEVEDIGSALVLAAKYRLAVAPRA
jgi:hypothetical protein